MIIPGVHTALQGVVLLERRLHRVQFAVVARPSTVRTSAPSACTASTEQDLTLCPFRCTVHAPQLLVSHPTTVPTLPNTSRR